MINDTLTCAELLVLEPIEPGLLRSNLNQDNRAGAIFGGQPLCQALVAARTTAPPWPAHSLSAMFLRGGVVAEPVDYRVETLRDGRRYASRRVLAMQRGQAIFDLLCSFHDPEDGPSHAANDLSGVAMPEDLPDLRVFCETHADRLPKMLVDVMRRPFPVDIRLIDPKAVLFGEETGANRDFWFRMPTASVVLDPFGHEGLLAFASDYWLAGTASAGYRPLPGKRGPAIASLNHSLWFHNPVDVADWLLYRTDSPWAGQGRGLARGLIYDRRGRLMASAAQEISLRTS
jgi:acyl-CoA thioesterase-2